MEKDLKTAQDLLNQARAIEARKSRDIDPAMVVFSASLAMIATMLLYMAITAISKPPTQMTSEAGATQLSKITLLP